MTKLSKKYNDSCIKMFEFLKLLYNNDATYENVIKLLSVDDDEKLTTAVLLNKYLNTLKIFGIKVEKNNNKYYMLNSPYKIDFNKIDLNAILLFKNSIGLLSDNKTKENIECLLENLFMRFNSDAQTYIESIRTDKYMDLSFFYTQFKEQISICEKYIKDNQRLNITYLTENNSENTINGVPIELKYLKRKICFVIYSNRDGYNTEIPINKIININQLPNQSSGISIPMTVAFRLKGRLAQSYKLKEFEHLDKKEENGDIVIINKGEALSSLMPRLIRYQEFCEIISPKSLKENMYNLINDMISKYDD